jgi:hypothetical protein
MKCTPKNGEDGNFICLLPRLKCKKLFLMAMGRLEADVGHFVFPAWVPSTWHLSW